MVRTILDEAHIHRAIRDAIASNNAEVVREVQAAIAGSGIVVIGIAVDMQQNQKSAATVCGKVASFTHYNDKFPVNLSRFTSFQQHAEPALRQ